MEKCKNCGKEFIRKNGKNKHNYMYCSGKCYWEYHLRDILKKEKENE